MGRAKVAPEAPTSRWHRIDGRLHESRFLLAALLAVGIVWSIAIRTSDVALYQRYAREALTSPPFHSLPREYPALSLLVFLLPQVVPSAYFALFALFAAVAGTAVVLSSDGLRDHPGWSSRTALYMVLGALAVVFARYDVFPVLAAVLALEGARRDRWGRAWVWAVVGGLLKLFPFLLLPGFLIAERSRTGKWAVRRVVVSGVSVGAVAVGQSLLAPGSLLSPLRYEFDRGFELSSLQGSLSFLVHPFGLHWILAFGSVEIIGPGHAVLGLTVSVAALVALIVIWVLATRGRLQLEAVSLAVLSVAVLADKAFAAQYILWLIPLWAYWPLRKGWVATATLTTLVFPFLYIEANVVGPGHYLATIGAVVRNVVLLGSTVCWLRDRLGTSGTSADARIEPLASVGVADRSLHHVNAGSGAVAMMLRVGRYHQAGNKRGLGAEASPEVRVGAKPMLLP